MGFYDGTTREMRIMFFAFCGAVFAFALRGVGEYLQSDLLNYAAMAIVSVSMVIGCWTAFGSD